MDHREVINEPGSAETPVFSETEKKPLVTTASRSNWIWLALVAVLITAGVIFVVTNLDAGSGADDLLLPPDRLANQQAGGTWSDLFDTEAPINRYPTLSAAVMYLVLSLLGWIGYPFTRLALRSLPDRGYPLVRLVGLLILTYLIWLLGSYQVPFTPLTITIAFLALLVVNLILLFAQREEIRQELSSEWKYILLVEGIILAFFVLFLLVRAGNPDLWHPWKGGEKPMDFSYFNAVLKSTSFPPYDPWFAGGYINYYYYGYAVVGVLVKWLGIVPAIAYNVILPVLFSLLAAGGFSLGWNLLSAAHPRADQLALEMFSGISPFSRRAPLWAGLASAVGLVILGNLGTVRMIWHGLQRLAPMQVAFEEAPFITRVTWTLQGLTRMFTNPSTSLPYGRGEWYWIPSRAIPGESITEFPAFTFLYADLHAHMIALPITVLVLAWAVSIVLGRWEWKSWRHIGANFLLGSLAIGALRPTNTWDWPTYLALGIAAVVYTALRYGSRTSLSILGVTRPWVKSGLMAVVSAALLVGLSTLLYQPYSDWYGQGYNQIDPWMGGHTPFWSYLTHWGVFLFIIVSWLGYETIEWMANTPISTMNRLQPYKGFILGGLVGLVALVVVLLSMGVAIGWLALPLAAWAGVLLLRPHMPDAKRVVLFLIGTALVLTLFVEVAVLRGDIGRMNTVFKFYLQAWTLLSLSAGISLFWLLPAMARSRHSVWKGAWEGALVLLVAGASLFPLLAGMDKINDRMAETAPHTLDGSAYMPYATYQEGETVMDLNEDYQAIRWMQENIPGSPVIVEANVPEYRWGSRFTIYTGLPGVVGWNWHQRQQRAVTPAEWVFERIDSIHQFYNTDRVEDAKNFLRRNAVKYIIVGQLERVIYTPSGLQKFEDLDGTLWREIYHQGQTAIYEVIEE